MAVTESNTSNKFLSSALLSCHELLIFHIKTSKYCHCFLRDNIGIIPGLWINVGVVCARFNVHKTALKITYCF